MRYLTGDPGSRTRTGVEYVMQTWPTVENFQLDINKTDDEIDLTLTPNPIYAAMGDPWYSFWIIVEYDNDDTQSRASDFLSFQIPI